MILWLALRDRERRGFEDPFTFCGCAFPPALYSKLLLHLGKKNELLAFCLLIVFLIL